MCSAFKPQRCDILLSIDHPQKMSLLQYLVDETTNASTRQTKYKIYKHSLAPPSQTHYLWFKREESCDHIHHYKRMSGDRCWRFCTKPQEIFCTGHLHLMLIVWSDFTANRLKNCGRWSPQQTVWHRTEQITTRWLRYDPQQLRFLVYNNFITFLWHHLEFSILAR